MIRAIHEKDLPSGSREVFGVDLPEMNNPTYLIPFVRRANKTYRIDVGTISSQHMLIHECDGNKCGVTGTFLVMLLKYDGNENSLTTLGTLHLSERAELRDYLPDLRRMAGWSAAEEVSVYEDVKKSMVSLLDTSCKCKDLDLGWGDTLVIQKASDSIAFQDVARGLPHKPIITTGQCAPLPPDQLRQHAATLWKERTGADIAIHYGPPESQRSIKAHRFVLSLSPYFHHLLHHETFGRVSDTTLDPSFGSKAVEIIIEYLYTGAVNTLVSTDTDTMMDLLSLCDFLLLENEFTALTAHFRLRKGDGGMAAKALTLGLNRPAAARLMEVVLSWVALNVTAVYAEGPFRDALLKDEAAAALVMEHIQSRLAGASN